MASIKRLMVCVTAAVVVAGLGACSGSASDRNQGAPDRGQGPVVGYEGRPESGTDVRTEDDPLSTFAVDVDTASYGYARRLINDGRIPDRDNIRAEEFVNSFAQGYPEPEGNGFAIHTDGAQLPKTHRGADGQRLLRIGLQTKSEDRRNRRDAALTFVVDVSGSMAEPGRLDLVRDALHTLVNQLRPTDSVAIVAFSSRARVVREMTRVSQREPLRAAIDKLEPEESTNLEAGLVLGYRVARDGFRKGAANRVVILSDGLANVGNTTSAPILEQVKEEARKQIALLGVGVGSDYGDALMEQLADNGDGFVVYVSDQADARKVFVERLPATLDLRALDAKVQVSFSDATVTSYRLIGYENRAIRDDQFKDNRIDGGEVGPGHSVTALYAIRVADGAEPGAPLATVTVRWTDPVSRKVSETTKRIGLSDVDGAFADASPRLHVCYAAAYLAESLRQSRAAEAVTLEDLAGIALAAADRTDDEAVRDLATTIEKAQRLN